MKELDDIAKDAVMYMSNSTFRSEQIIRAALEKALEYALTKEPSSAVLFAGHNELERLNGSIPHSCLTAYHAMTKQLLAEISTNEKNNTDA